MQSPTVCPVCSRPLDLVPEAQRDGHVTRCLRQTSKSRNVAVGSSFLEDSSVPGDSASENSTSELFRHDFSSDGDFSAYSDDVGASDDDESVGGGAGALEASSDPKTTPKKRLRQSMLSSRPKETVVSRNGGSRVKSRKCRRRETKCSDDMNQSHYLQRIYTLNTAEANALSTLNDEPEAHPVTDKYITPFGSTVVRRVWDSLYEHQRSGCEWLWRLYQEQCGGILADEMGLGKTAQVCVHFEAVANSLLSSDCSPSSPVFLAVCPASVLRHWVQEAHAWAPRMRTCLFHAINDTFSEIARCGETAIREELHRLSRRSESPGGLIVVLTYEGLRSMRRALLPVAWSGVCVDEGQKLRNTSAEITSVCKMLSAHHRILLSGTPIQNSLMELWSLIDFCYPGKLGTAMTFESEFSDPIREGSYAGSSRYKIDVAFKTALRLQHIIRPYLLRRRKCDASVSLILPHKSEQVLFCRLTRLQRKIYGDIINSPEVERAIRFRRPLFSTITTLRKLCNHPIMSYHRGRIVWHDDTDDDRADGVGGPLPAAAGSAIASFDTGTASRPHLFLASDINWEESGKLIVLSQILPIWHNEGHKVLLFSQTQSMLNIVEQMIKQLNFKYLRLDGSTSVGKRDGLIKQFNDRDGGVFTMLLTTRAGGLGISLTGANRVILLDPDWNPQTDIQARERAWRIGQQREVTVYRLITKGTIEEKIYNKQISKILLSERILLNPRHGKIPISKSDVKSMFELPPDDCIDPSSTSYELCADSLAVASGESLFDKNIEVEVDNSLATEDGEIMDAGIAVTEPKDWPPLESSGIIEKTTSCGIVQGDCHVASATSFKNSRPGLLDRQGRKVVVSIEEKKERALVSALYNGEAIADVFEYDTHIVGSRPEHNIFSNSMSGSSNSINSSEATFSSEFSGPASKQLLNGLKNLTAEDMGSEHYMLTHPNASSSSNVQYAPQPAGERTGRLMKVLSAPARSKIVKTLDTPANVFSRLQKLFADSSARYSTAEVLGRFRDLDDKYAEIFRDLLRNVATFNNLDKTWRKRM